MHNIGDHSTASTPVLALEFGPTSLSSNLAAAKNAALPYDRETYRDAITMDTSTARLFAQYRAWADKLTYEAVAALPAGEAEKERPTLFKTIIGTLNHNYLIDRVWQAHIEGCDHGFRARNLILHVELPALWDAQRAMNRWWTEWSAAQSSTSLAESVHFRFIGGEESAMTRGTILLHVVNHATYHRGWVADMFFQVPAKNPTTDLPVFLGEARPY